MNSYFVHAHCIGGNRFLIGGPISPVSIRDQIIRGQLLVEALWQDGTLDKKSKRLLVIGAGAGGAAAAITAVRHGLEIVLADKQSGPFSVQSRCRTRWIDPTQYDWPATHWLSKRYPPTAPTYCSASATYSVPVLPLAKAQSASDHAREWKKLLNKILHVWPHLTIRYGVTPKRKGVNPNGKLIYEFNQTIEQFDVCIYAYGVGTEATTWTGKGDRYFGYQFWEDDPFEDTGAGINTQSIENETVLVSGGGDGALQDFIRLSTGKSSAREVLEHLGLANADYSLIHALTDNAMRTWAVSNRPDQDKLRQQKLDAFLRDTIGRLMPGCHKQIQSITADRPAVTLVHRGEVPTAFYPLNLYVALLLSEGCSRLEIKSDTQIGMIEYKGSRSPAPTTAQECWGDYWNAEVKTTTTGQFTNVNCRGIVIRHGVGANQTPSFQYLPLWRHPLPYFPPN